MISVVIPTYNRPQVTLRAIESVMKQGINELEIIVVDDGSTDNTKEIIEGLNNPYIRYIYQNNGGVSSARNTGIKAAKGDYIALLDSDDILKVYSLLYRKRFLDENPQYDAVIGSFIELDSENKIIFGKSKILSEKKLKNFDLKYKLAFARSKEEMSQLYKDYVEFNEGGIPYICSALMFRKDILNKIALFNEELRNSEDLEFLYRLTRDVYVKYDFLRVDVYFQMQDGGLSRNLKEGKSVNQQEIALDLIKKS